MCDNSLSVDSGETRKCLTIDDSLSVRSVTHVLSLDLLFPKTHKSSPSLLPIPLKQVLSSSSLFLFTLILFFSSPPLPLILFFLQKVSVEIRRE